MKRISVEAFRDERIRLITKDRCALLTMSAMKRVLVRRPREAAANRNLDRCFRPAIRLSSPAVSPALQTSNPTLAEALVDVLGSSRWSAVALAKSFLAWQRGESNVAQILYQQGSFTLRASQDVVKRFGESQITEFLEVRKKTGSAETPVTKLSPATITEQLFLGSLDALKEAKPTLDYSDDRQSEHKFKDFTLREGGLELPVNVKNAGTRFNNARQLVGL